PWANEGEGDGTPSERRCFDAQRPAAAGPRSRPGEARGGPRQPVPQRVGRLEILLVQSGEREEWGPINRGFRDRLLYALRRNGLERHESPFVVQFPLSHDGHQRAPLAAG